MYKRYSIGMVDKNWYAPAIPPLDTHHVHEWCHRLYHDCITVFLPLICHNRLDTYTCILYDYIDEKMFVAWPIGCFGLI